MTELKKKKKKGNNQVGTKYIINNSENKVNPGHEKYIEFKTISTYIVYYYLLLHRYSPITCT